MKVVNTLQEACKDLHPVAVLTEWDEFKCLDWLAVYEDMLKPAFLFDGRRLWIEVQKKKLASSFMQ